MAGRLQGGSSERSFSWLDWSRIQEISDDDLIWSVTKRLDRIRFRLLQDLKGLAPVTDSNRNLNLIELNRPHSPVEPPKAFLAGNQAGIEFSLRLALVFSRGEDL